MGNRQTLNAIPKRVESFLNNLNDSSDDSDGTFLDNMFVPSFLNDQTECGDSGDETVNGLCFNNVYIPEEVVVHILSFVNPKDLLRYSEVCHKWNKLIKSHTLWTTIYKRKYNRKPKNLPWYLYYCLLSTNYFDTNLLLNGNGQDGFRNWKFLENGGHQCIIENSPVGADPLPLDVPEFNNKTSCFATSYGICYKVQSIKLGKNKLFCHILNNYKPHIYLSEWTAGRFDCGSKYKLQCGFKRKYLVENDYIKPHALHFVNQWEGSKWKKIEITVVQYPDEIEEVIFEHKGCDTQVWAGHYGSKMAGGVIKFLFDTIEPLDTDANGNHKPRRFSEIEFFTNGLKENEVDNTGWNRI